mgnify:CR=1 FL=1
MVENRQFSFILISSTLFHAALIFGLHWTFDDPIPPSQTLDITLAQFASKDEPEEADFLAQAHQQGSGTLAEKKELSTLEQAQFQANEIREVQQTQAIQQQEQQAKQAGPKVLSTVQTSWAQTASEEAELEVLKNNLREIQQRNQISSEIATLEAELKNERQSYAKRPRRRQLTAVATKASLDAAYLSSWRQKIESVGNMNYPDLNIYGELTLLVAVRANGTIERVEVRRSSGYRSLDDAAKHIVRQAAPFDAFPEDIRKHTDILEIIRTWRFEKGGYLSSSQG